MSAVPRPIRVMEVIDSLHIGGAEQVVLNLARGLDRRRFELVVCCTRELGVIAEQLRSEGVDVRLVKPKSRRARYLTPLAIALEARKWKADLVHTHGAPAMMLVGPPARLGLLPRWIHTFHYGNYDAPVTPLMNVERLFWRGASDLIAVSEAQRQSIMRRYSIPQERIDVILNGVAENRFVNDEAMRLAKRNEFGLSADDTVVGCVAVLTEQKGITYLLQAARQVLASDPRVRFLIVGGGPLERTLREEAASIDGADRIVFTGWRQDGLQILPCLDIFIMSSLWEAMPMALLEAMAARRPIVVTDVGQNRMIVDGGRCGILIPPRDPGAIARATIGLLRNPAEAHAMALRAYERFGRSFTTSQMVTAYENLFARRRPDSGIQPVSAGRVA